MKKTQLIVTAAIAAMALAFAACEKELEVVPAPETTSNPLVGTSWLYHHDTIIMGIHVVQETRLAFLTDTTGEDYIGGEDSYSSWWDTTYHFKYVFHHEVNGVELYEDNSHIPSYFRYYPEDKILTQQGTVFHLIEE